MNKQHKIIATIGAGVAGLALIGAGAGATFTDSVNAQQAITAGTLDVQISGGPSGSTLSQDGKTITLPAVGPTASTFAAQSAFKFVNNGTVPANAIKLSASVPSMSGADQALFNQTYVEVDSYNPTWQQGPNSPVVVFNGPLSTLVANGQAIAGTLAPQEQDSLVVTFYAGDPYAPTHQNPNNAADVGYGNNIDNVASLLNSAQGGTVTPTLSISYEG